jgi:hypothetical protein
MTQRRRRPLRGALLVALFVAVSASPIWAQGPLDKVAAFDPTIPFGSGNALTIEPQLQTRWTAVETGGAESDTVVGFSVPRARLIITTRLADDAFRFRLRIGNNTQGTGIFQQAYGEANWNHFRLRVGQMVLVLNAGEEPVMEGLSPADFSSYSNAFAGGSTQGVQLAYRGPVRFIATVGNGARVGFSELLAPIVADVATTGRFELPIGPQGLNDYDSMATFRLCQPLNARAGLTGHYQNRGRNDGTKYNLYQVSADFGVRASGFTVLTSGTYLRLVPVDQPIVQAGGLFVFGSLFLSRYVESFAQFDAVWPLGDKAPLPPDFATSSQPGSTMFRTVTIGSNFFIIPDMQRLKVQMDVQAMFDGQATSFIPANPALGVLPSSGPQVAMRLQLLASL